MKLPALPRTKNPIGIYLMAAIAFGLAACSSGPAWLWVLATAFVVTGLAVMAVGRSEEERDVLSGMGREMLVAGLIASILAGCVSTAIWMVPASVGA